MRVIFLLGPSSAGKSTLCNELVEKHGWESLSIDEVMLGYYRDPNPVLDPLMREELVKHRLVATLSGYLSEADLLQLCKSGILSISLGEHPIESCAFSSPALSGLEKILLDAGFSERDVPSLAEKLRQVTSIGESVYAAHPMGSPTQALYERVFHAESVDKDIVLDVVPLAGSAESILEELQSKAQVFRDAHPDIDLDVYPVLAYIPPEALSERIKRRNEAADARGDLTDKRSGLFPFEQLSVFVDDAGTSHEGFTITRDQLFSYVQHHSRAQKTGALVLENSFDPSALECSSEDPGIVLGDDGRVTLDPCPDTKEKLGSEAASAPRIGTEEQIEQYRNLTERFKLGMGQESGRLDIANKEAYSLVLDMSQGTPEEKTRELISHLSAAKPLSPRR